MRVLLLVEDNPGDVELVRLAVEDVAPHVELAVVHDGDRALAYLRRSGEYADAKRPDLVLLDLKLPRRDGLQVLRDIKRDPALRRLPVVVLTSSKAPSDLERAWDLQATACFCKPATGYDELIGKIVSFAEAAADQTVRDEPEGNSRGTDYSDELGEIDRARYLAALVDRAGDAIIGVDLEGTIESWNRAAEQLYGYPAEDAVGRHIRLIVPDGRLDEVEQLLSSVQADETARSVETVRVDSHGREVEVSLTVSFVADADGTPIGKSVIARDVTGRRQAERQFRLAVESSPSAMVMVDADGSIGMVNAETERLFGYDRDELIGSTIELLVPQRFRSEHPELRAGFMRAPEARAMGAGRELYGLHKDGHEIPVEIGLNPIRTEDGLYVLSSIVDVTERQQAEHKFRLAVEASPSGIVMVDGDGTIVLVNRETERMFGYDRGELVGESVDVLVPQRVRTQHAHDRDRFLWAPEARAMGSGRDLFGLRKDGTEFPVEIGLNPIRTPSGRLVLSTIVDITNRKLAEDALAERTTELARSNAELEQFAYVASHDLQEPLRMVASYTDLLARRYGDRLDERAAKYIGYAQEGAARMRRLIEDLLAYSRVRSRGRDPQRVEASRCLTQALENLRLQIRESGAEVDRGELPAVLADETQLTEVFQNLLSNALKFHADDPPRIRIRSEPRGKDECFYVEDNGIGVSDEHANRIFHVFERLHTREEYPGTGIGLALCKRVVERHDGSIGVHLNDGGGSTFWFTLRAADRCQPSEDPSPE